MANNEPTANLFILNDGILDYYNKDFHLAITKINKALKGASKPENWYLFENYNKIDAYYFLGKSYEKIGLKNKEIVSYKRADSLISKTNYLVPEIRSSYTAIIDYYKSRDSIQQQLYYINRLLEYDSILDHNLMNLSIKLNEQYDAPNLVLEKERLITILKDENKTSTKYLLVSIIFIGVISTLFLSNYRKKKTYKQRFEKLINSTHTEEVIISNKKIKTEEISIDIAKNTIDQILINLDKFERNNGFTQINLTTNILAKKVQTNSKYLSKVIKFYKKKNFSPYINDLRVDYIIDRLKIEKKLQNYTIKALATEAGFNSSEAFSKYFYKKNGIYPSYFIKKIQSYQD